MEDLAAMSSGQLSEIPVRIGEYRVSNTQQQNKNSKTQEALMSSLLDERLSDSGMDNRERSSLQRGASDKNWKKGKTLKKETYETTTKAHAPLTPGLNKRKTLNGKEEVNASPGIRSSRRNSPGEEIKITHGSGDDMRDIPDIGAELSGIARKDSQGGSFTEEDLKQIQKIQSFSSESIKNPVKEKRKKIAGYIVLTGLCVYLMLLIAGSAMTTFSYDKNGTVAPQEMSISDIRKKEKFQELLSLYYSARRVYEKVLVLDYRVTQEKENVIEIGSEYQAVIDEIDKSVAKLDSSTLDSSYTQVGGMIYTFLNTHLVSYCNYMAIALSSNDASAADQALSAREEAESMFEKATENVLSLGKDIKGVELEDVYKWSPSGYINEAVLGLPQEKDET